MSRLSENKEIFPRTPKWLTRVHIESVLREVYGDQIDVVQMEVLPATAKDQNFASVLFRLRLQQEVGGGVEHQMNYIIKTSLENGQNESLHNALEVYDVYTNETLMYTKVLPKVANILKNIGCKDQFAPHIIKIDPDRKYILFEDLCAKNYLMKDKRVGLDALHARVILEKVARLHAAAAKINEIERGTFQVFDKGIFNGECNGFEPFFAGQLQACGRSIQQWKGFEEYGKKILNLVPTVMRHGREAFQCKQDHFNTIIHADLWVNNIMFKSCIGYPLNIILLDFQFSCWASPTLDLHYFFNTSLDLDTRINCEETLFRHYCQVLRDTLKRLEFRGKIPTVEELWDQYLEKGFYAVTSACIILPLVLNELEVEGSSLMQNDEVLVEAKQRIYDQPKIQKFLKRLLPVFDRCGYLNKK